MPEIKGAVRRILEEALEGRITLAEFYNRWPADANREGIYGVIFKDLEDGITHTPGKLFAKGVDKADWERSGEYFKIKGHLQKL